MILITGAAGKTGREVIRALFARGHAVRALVHRDQQARLVQSLGARETVVGDMRDEATLREAVRGVRAVYHICPNISSDEVAIGRVTIAAAEAAEVEQFVFHSVLHPQIEDMPHHWNKLRVEEMLLLSKLPYTILQPSNYMQNIVMGLQPGDYVENVLAGWRAIVERGVYGVPYSVESRTRWNMVDLEDIAQAAAVVLGEPGYLGATYELAGPDTLTQTQIAEMLSKKLGRTVQAEQVTMEAWTRQALSSGMNSYKIQTLLKMFRYYDRCDFLGNSHVLELLIGHAPTTFEAFVERTIREQANTQVSS